MLTGNHIQAYLTRTARDNNNNKQKHKREQVNRLLGFFLHDCQIT